MKPYKPSPQEHDHFCDYYIAWKTWGHAIADDIEREQGLKRGSSEEHVKEFWAEVNETFAKCKRIFNDRMWRYTQISHLSMLYSSVARAEDELRGPCRSWTNPTKEQEQEWRENTLLWIEVDRRRIAAHEAQLGPDGIAYMIQLKLCGGLQ